jgi:2'-5' RNA ligase
MSRFFLALPLPESVREHLANARPPQLPGINLVRPDQMHVTLHFLGELDDDDLEVTRRAMSTILSPRFSLGIAGVGTFPEKGPPRVIWAGVEACSRLSALQLHLGECLKQAINFQPEDRPYKPHITLSRVKPPVTRSQLHDYFEGRQHLAIPQVPIDRIVLFQSLFVDGRLVYREEAAWELGDESAT